MDGGGFTKKNEIKKQKKRKKKNEDKKGTAAYDMLTGLKMVLGPDNHSQYIDMYLPGTI